MPEGFLCSVSTSNQKGLVRKREFELFKSACAYVHTCVSKDNDCVSLNRSISPVYKTGRSYRGSIMGVNVDVYKLSHGFIVVVRVVEIQVGSVGSEHRDFRMLR